MNDYLEAEKRDLKRRRRERYLIVGLIGVISFLTYLGLRSFGVGIDLPVSSSILIFALININVILLLLLLYFIMRNLVKLLFERRKNIMGAKLRTRLVFAFLTLSLIPTIVLFFASVQFISSSIEYWFNLQIEQALKNALEVGQDYYDSTTDELLSFGNNLSRVVSYDSLMEPQKGEELEELVNEKQKEYGLASIRIYTRRLEVEAESRDKQVDFSLFKKTDGDVLMQALDEGTDTQHIQSSAHGDLVTGITPVFSQTESKAVVGLIVLSEFIPASFVNHLKAGSRGLQEYKQLEMLKQPFKVSHLIWFSMVTLLIVFSAIWFGFYLSRQITVPIRELAEGTKRIALGDYDVFIDLEAKDEIGDLVYSFNKMAADLKTSKNKIEEANLELRKSNFEIEQRRRYMEIVLANVAAGVVSADQEGKILTINKSAEKMLNVNADEIIGKSYREILPDEYVERVDEFLREKRLFEKGYLNKQINLTVQNKVLTLLVSLNVLKDDRGSYLGLVAVLEDLTEIEKAQRMAAWREVARRIAHEVKNPLTPIQLSAQRLKKKYGERLEGDDVVIFKDCTDMIIKQVEGLKRLVNEFSNFARMPTANPVPSDLTEIIGEAMNLYKEANRDVRLTFEDPGNVPVFNLDREQIKRVMINLLDNAIEAIDGKGEVVVKLQYDQVLQLVTIEVVDNGIGIAEEDELRLFEPYFSTKTHGTGLGLSIVNTIISDHNGFIRIRKNEPKGTKVIVELPVKV